MDEEYIGSPEDDMSSPRDFALASPQDLQEGDAISPQSDGTQDVTSDIEVDVWHQMPLVSD